MEEDYFHKTVLRHLQSHQISHYLTSSLQKKDLDYPLDTINGQQCTEMDLVLLGLDCEMVLTDHGPEVCQVVIIDQFGHILYNSNFKPKNTIIDYITHITGLSHANFHPDARTVLSEKDIEQIQLICKGKVIVGHDLANDLKVLPIKHKTFIDTLALYPHNYGLPFKTKLKNLAYQLLRRPIQWDIHNAIEDSLAAIDIVKLHISQGKGTIQQVEYKIANFESIEQLIKQAQLDKEKMVAFILRGSRALKLQIEQHGYFSDWDYVCVYHTTAPINGRLIKLHNIDITIYDETTFYKIIDGNDIALLELYYLPQQCQYINKLNRFNLDRSLLLQTLGHHLWKCDRKVKRINTMYDGQKRNWKILKTYHMKARFLNYFMQFYTKGQIIDIMETHKLWKQLKEKYIANFNFEQAQKWIMQNVKVMYNEVRKLKKANPLFKYYGKKDNAQKYNQTESNIQIMSNQYKQKNCTEINMEDRLIIKNERYMMLQKYILSVPKIVNPLNLSLVHQLLTYGLQRMQSFRIAYKRHKHYLNLIQFHYLQSADFHLPICRESRGIILDEANDYAVVSLPYFKFFDYNDKQYGQLSKFDFSNCKLYEKYDGSLASLYFYGGQWEVSSSKVPDGQNRYCFARLQTEKEFKQQFFQIFYEAGYPLPSEQDRDKTFIFELLSKDHIIVVRRETSEIRLHGVNDRITGVHEDHQSYAKKYGWMSATALQKEANDIEEIVALAKELNPLKHEGYVLCDKNYCRLKVKCPDYLRVNWLGELNLNADKNPKRYLLTEIVLAGQAEVFCQYCPQWEKPIRQWINKIKYLNNKCIQIYNSHPNLLGKQLAMEISKQPKYLHPFLFQLFANFEKWANRLEYLMPAKKIYNYLQKFQIDDKVI